MVYILLGNHQSCEVQGLNSGSSYEVQCNSLEQVHMEYLCKFNISIGMSNCFEIDNWLHKVRESGLYVNYSRAQKYFQPNYSLKIQFMNFLQKWQTIHVECCVSN